MIAIVDYGMGNLRSVQKALERVGATAEIASTPDELTRAEGIVLPGVGAFGQAMENLRQAGWIDPLVRMCSSGRPFIGICLGMQLLCESSEEMGRHEGLGIVKGQVNRFAGPLKVPQMGWNQIHLLRADSLMKDVPDGSYAFFVHSYYCAPTDPSTVIGTTDYGIEFASVIQQGNVFGAQFHPEKSQAVGLKMLENFAAMTR